MILLQVVADRLDVMLMLMRELLNADRWPAATLPERLLTLLKSPLLFDDKRQQEEAYQMTKKSSVITIDIDIVTE